MLFASIAGFSEMIDGARFELSAAIYIAADGKNY